MNENIIILFGILFGMFITFGMFDMLVSVGAFGLGKLFCWVHIFGYA